jgi:DNA gyrase subunit A
VKALLEISANEDITTIVSLQGFTEEQFLLMATARGIIKKVKTHDFRNARTRGIIALKLDDGDRLITAVLTNGENEVVLVSRNGNALRFHENQVRAMGRASRGVTGIRLQNDDELAGILRVENDEMMLLLSENGLGKRVDYDNFAPHGRATRGQIAYKKSDRSGEIVGVLSVLEDDDLVCITSQGNTIKLQVADVPIQGKTAQGVNIVTITAPDVVVDVARVMNETGQNGAEENGAAEESVEIEESPE